MSKRLAASTLAACCALLALALPAVAQSVRWAQVVHGPGGAAATLGDGELVTRSLAADASGNVFVTGTTASGTQRDVLTTKLAAATGAVAWQKRFAGPAGAPDDGFSVAVDGAGNAVVAGLSVNASRNNDILVIKYAAADGAVLWQRTIDAGLNESAYVAAVDASGDVLVGGDAQNGAGNMDMRVLKLAGADGATLWDRTFDGGDDDFLVDLAADGSGDVVAAGITTNAAGNRDLMVLRLAGNNGRTVWQRAHDGGLNDVPYAIALDASGNVFVTGYSSVEPGNASFTTLKLAANGGTVLWQQSFDGGLEDYGTAVAVDGEGNAIVTGQSQGAAGHFDFRTIKYAASSGAVLWQRAFDGGSQDFPYQAAVDASGNAVIVGSTGSGTSANWKALTYAAADGALLAQHDYAGSANADDHAYAVVATADGVVVAGTSVEAGKPVGIRVVKLAAAAAAATPVALENGGFESPTGMSQMPAGWTGTGGTITAPGLAYYGAPAAPEGAQAAFLYQTAAGLRQSLQLAAGAYTVTFRAAAPTKWPSAPVKVRVNGADVATVRPASGAWGTYTAAFNAPGAGTYAVELGSDGAPSGMVFIDDVRVAAGAADGTPPPVALDNGSFESPPGMSQVPAGWSGGGTITNPGLAYYGAPPSPDGSQAAYIYASTAGPRQSLQLQAGLYKLTLRAAVPTTWPAAPVKVRLDGVEHATLTPPRDAWTSFNVTLKVGQSGTHVLEIGSDGSHGMVFVDGVSITPTSSFVVALQNGGFEAPEGVSQRPAGWTGPGGTITNPALAYYGAPAAPEGGQAAYLYNTTGGVSQVLALAQGAYDVSFRAATPTAWSPAALRVRLSGTEQAAFSPPPGVWTPYTVRITAPRDGDFILEIASDGAANGMVFIDAVSIAAAQ